MKATFDSKKKSETKQCICKQLKICINCGNTEVQEYEFGISCELCGTSFYFGKIDSKEVN